VPAAAPAPALSPPDRPTVPTPDAFRTRLHAALARHACDEGFGTAELARALGVSRSTLYRRLRGLLSGAPAEALWTLRLEHGAAALAAGGRTVAEVAYAVGFRSVSHFCTRFRERYGTTPAAYRRDALRRAESAGAEPPPRTASPPSVARS
jgi:AraC-like DNA-binding protein